MKVEIYPKKYLPDQIDLEHAKINVTRPIITYLPKDELLTETDAIHFVIDDENHSFWPVIMNLTLDEAKKLSKALNQLLDKKSFDKQETIIIGGAIKKLEDENE